MKRRIIVGLTGASGVIYGIRTLMHLRSMSDVETHLVLSEERGSMFGSKPIINSMKSHLWRMWSTARTIWQQRFPLVPSGPTA